MKDKILPFSVIKGNKKEEVEEPAEEQLDFLTELSQHIKDFVEENKTDFHEIVSSLEIIKYAYIDNILYGEDE